MATITRYVNTGSSGGNGTTSALTGDNAAYASLNAWEAAEDGIDHAGDDMVVNCAGATDDGAGTCVIDSGWTADSISIIGDADGVWDDSHYTMGVGNWQYILIQHSDVSIANIQYNQGVNNANYINFTGDYDGGELKNCILKSDSSTSYLVRIVNGSVAVSNTIFYGSNGEGILLSYPGISSISNCTFYDCDYGIYMGGGTSTNITAKNNVAIDCLTADFSLESANVDHNCSSDTSATGTGSLTEKTAANNFTSVTAGSEDFSVKDTDADIYNAGTTISGVTTDAAGTSRPQATTYDIGAFEFEVTITNTGGLLTIW